MKRLLLILFSIPAFLSAQTEQRYLKGAVPEESGKVIFTKEIAVPSYTKQQIYDVMLAWATNNFNTSDSRVVYADPEKGEIAAMVQEYLVFSSTALSLDRTEADYRVTMECEDGKCLLKIGGIRYTYDVAYQREPEVYRAEEWITDAFSLNKKGTKLNRLSGKFRRKTIDRVDELFGSATAAVGNKLLAEAGTPAANAASSPQVPDAQGTVAAVSLAAGQSTTSAVRSNPAIAAATPPANLAVTIPNTSTPANTGHAKPSGSLPSKNENPSQETPAPEGYMPLPTKEIPATLQVMLSESRIELNLPDAPGLVEKEAAWKGIGTMLGKAIASVGVPAGGAFDRALEGTAIFRIAFFRPDETAPWMILACSKQGDTTEAGEKTLLCEMTNVWIK